VLVVLLYLAVVGAKVSGGVNLGLFAIVSLAVTAGLWWFIRFLPGGVPASFSLPAHHQRRWPGSLLYLWIPGW
jgi:hypothetical protein